MEPAQPVISSLRHAIMSPLSGLYMALQLEKKPELVARLKMVLDRLELLFTYAEQHESASEPISDEEALARIKALLGKEEA